MAETPRNRRKVTTKTTKVSRNTKAKANTSSKTVVARSTGRSSAASSPRKNSSRGRSTSGVAPYKPKKNEPYMSEGQVEHFRAILENWKRELMEEVDRTIDLLQEGGGALPDTNDRATQETDLGLELRTRDRGRKLIRKVDAALERISDGTYGYCEETGEEIGLRRLEARPIATLCLEAQERHELTERHYSKRDGRSGVAGDQ